MITLLIIAIAVFVGDIIIQRLIAQRLPSNKLPVRWSDGSACSLTGLQIMRPLTHHPGFFAWPGVFASATLAVSHWVPVAPVVAAAALYGLGWVVLLEHYPS